MSSKDYKPWWERVGDLHTAAEQEEFIRGVGGAKKPSFGENVILSLIAGYVGGKIAQRTGKKK